MATASKAKAGPRGGIRRRQRAPALGERTETVSSAHPTWSSHPAASWLVEHGGEPSDLAAPIVLSNSAKASAMANVTFFICFYCSLFLLIFS